MRAEYRAQEREALQRPSASTWETRLRNNPTLLGQRRRSSSPIAEGPGAAADPRIERRSAKGRNRGAAGWTG
jgi:hypothetical protein